MSSETAMCLVTYLAIFDIRGEENELFFQEFRIFVASYILILICPCELGNSTLVLLLFLCILSFKCLDFLKGICSRYRR